MTVQYNPKFQPFRNTWSPTFPPCTNHILINLSMVQIRPFEHSYQQRANLLAMEGNIQKVREFYTNNYMYPNTKGANLAARCGHINMLKFLISNGINPSREGVRGAAEKGYIKVIKFLGRAGICLHGAADAALVRGHFGIVLFLRNHRIYPTQTGVDIAMGLNNFQAVGFAKSRFNLYPSSKVPFENVTFSHR